MPVSTDRTSLGSFVDREFRGQKSFGDRRKWLFVKHENSLTDLWDRQRY